VPRNTEEDSGSQRSTDDHNYINEEPLTLKGEIPTKHQIKGYEETNKIKKGILNNNKVKVSVSDITILKANIMVQYTCQIVILRVKTEIVELRENYDVKRSMEDFKGS